MTIKTNMTTEQKFFRFQDMINQNLEIIKENEDFSDGIGDKEVLINAIELVTMIYTTIELTEINQKMIDEYLKSEININTSELQNIINLIY
ncbi:hypothetical protein [Mammaliicoccus sciuri]|uniref:hypothetical protein n=1 Tax=Mammaliicoccus sciuri TaxID=1296 RepID=UPI002B261CA7|nr:hypothetical protein [Mammaliicoccus sciuri]WQK75186.1 hypothetical protein P3U33_05510 [Mammaliicoccus sciuri]